MFISDEHHWQTDYKLSLNLFDAAAEAACDIGKINAVASYSDEVLANAKSLGDKLACECTLFPGRLQKRDFFLHTHCVCLYTGVHLRSAIYCKSASKGWAASTMH